MAAVPVPLNGSTQSATSQETTQARGLQLGLGQLSSLIRRNEEQQPSPSGTADAGNSTAAVHPPAPALRNAEPLKYARQWCAHVWTGDQHTKCTDPRLQHTETHGLRENGCCFLASPSNFVKLERKLKVMWNKEILSSGGHSLVLCVWPHPSHP